MSKARDDKKRRAQHERRVKARARKERRAKSRAKAKAALAHPVASLARYLLAPQHITEGNDVRLLVNGGAVYPAMLEAIAGAKETVNLETYIFAADQTGWQFAQALAQRARAGVEVNLLLDGLGSIGLSSDLMSHLSEAGVRITWYRPLAPWRRGWGWWRRDHKKILVADGEVGFVGGLNIGDDYAPEERGGRGWRDTHALLQGPVVRQLQLAFLHTWDKAHGPPLRHRLHLKQPEPPADAPALILTNGLKRQRRQIRRAYLHALKRAEEYIYISNAYFIPGVGIRRRLRLACKRGVDVRILVAGTSDVPVVTAAARHLYGRLLRWGARIFEWSGPMIHAKTAVVDGRWATVGSSNLDMLSMRYNLETNVVVLGDALAEPLRERFLEDTDHRHAREVTLEQWRQRPWLQRVVQSVAYRLRKVM